MATTTITLKNASKKLFTDDWFMGVFSSNQLPKYSPKSFGLIVNYDTHNLPGSHWMAIISRDGEGYYFDPFGYDPPLNITSWLNHHFDNWSYNKRQVQAIDSNYCGYFCLHFLFSAKLSFFKYIDLEQIIDHLYPKILQYSHYQAIVNEFINTQNI